MKPPKHVTADAFYYDTRAECYDQFNEINSKAINTLLEKILKEHHVATVLDLTCGTGSQVFWLTSAGFQVVGSDISTSMLKIAQEKARLKKAEITFLLGDCRTINAGKFDAAITIFNAIGHLTRDDFKRTIQNVHRMLNPGGLYIFDIFNLDYLKAGSHITRLTGDWMTLAPGGSLCREIQFSTISDDGILASYSTYVYQDGNQSPTKVSKGYENTLQVYTAAQLQEILKENGFVVVAQTDIQGQPFSPEESERILTVAQKV